MPVGVKLGLAGGPLIVSLLLSRVRRIGPMVFYMPKSANIMMREFGIVLFLACAGLKSGDTFVSTLMRVMALCGWAMPPLSLCCRYWSLALRPAPYGN
jgi:putative transport protein